MFQHLLEFSYKRTKKQAVGFYLAWFLCVVLFGALVGGILGSAGIIEDSFDGGLKVGQLIAIFATIVLTVIIVRDKKRMGFFSSYIYILCAGILAYFGGALLGLIISAYLTTQDERGNTDISEKPSLM